MERDPTVSGLKRVAMTREQSWTFELLPEALAELGIEAQSIMHVGAHKGEEVPIYQKCGFDQITLVEPDPVNAAVPARRVPGRHRVAERRRPRPGRRRSIGR